MRIAVVSYNCCVRCSQSSLAAQKFGHEVHLVVSHEAAQRQFNDRFASESVYWTPKQLRQAIDNIEPDLIHVHDRPHQIASDVVKAKFGVPVVVDVHDQDSLLGMPMGSPMNEVVSIQKADGLVFVSEPYREWAEEGLGPLPPSVVVPSMVCEDIMPQLPERKPRLGGACWEGGLYVHNRGDPRWYIDQREIVKGFTSVGVACCLHSAPEGFPDNVGPYTEAGGTVFQPAGYVPLLRLLTQYDFGWYGQAADSQSEQIHRTLPNKLFDYVAAGLPVVVVNAREAARYVEENGLGVAIETPEQIRMHIDRILDMRKSDVIWREKRMEFTRERAIQPLLDLYDRLVPSKARPPKPVAAKQLGKTMLVESPALPEMAGLVVS